MTPYLRKEEYADDIVSMITAGSLEDLSTRLKEKGMLDCEQLLHTVEEFNHAVQAHRAEHPQSQWDPAVKDGLSTQSFATRLTLPKSNWALTIEQPPFLAVAVSSGITFTFGGLAIDPSTAGVISAETNLPIPGLFATGEVVGG
jgi:predicted oxidoreductase